MGYVFWRVGFLLDSCAVLQDCCAPSCLSEPEFIEFIEWAEFLFVGWSAAACVLVLPGCSLSFAVCSFCGVAFEGISSGMVMSFGKLMIMVG